MKTTLMISSALALLAAPALAQTTQDAARDRGMQHQPGAPDQRADGALNEWTDDGHPLQGAAVYTKDAERVGSVDRIRPGSEYREAARQTDAMTELDAQGLVVETGGFLGIGTREVRVERGDAQLATVNGEKRIILSMTHDEFERLPEHDRGDGFFDGGEAFDDAAGRSPQGGAQDRRDHDRRGDPNL